MLKANSAIKKFLAQPSNQSVQRALTVIGPEYQPRIVGGVVRNAFFQPENLTLNPTKTDIDITINTPSFPDALLKTLNSTEEITTLQRTPRNLLLKFTIHGQRKCIEVTPLQKQTDNGFETACDWDDSAKHRDLKCNSLMYDLYDEEVLDLVDGSFEATVAFNKLTTIKGDPSRMFRFFRFVGEKNDGSFDEESLERIIEHKHLLENVAAKQRSLDKLFRNSERPGIVVNKILEMGLSREIFQTQLTNGKPFEDEVSIQDLSDRIENMKDIPLFAESMNLSKQDCYELLMRRIDREDCLEDMVDKYNYIHASSLIRKRLMSTFKSKFMFPKEDLRKLGKNNFMTWKNYQVTMVPSLDFIKEYIVLNY